MDADAVFEAVEIMESVSSHTKEDLCYFVLIGKSDLVYSHPHGATLV